MREIKRLVQILHRLSGKNPLQVFKFYQVSESSRVISHRLLAKVQAGKVSNDAEAAAALYEGAEAEDQRFRMVKSRARAKLNKLIHFWALEKGGREPTEVECMAFLSRAKIFLNEQEFDLAEKQLKNAIEIALQGEFTELHLMALRMLRTIHSALYRPKQLRDIISRIAKYEALDKAEDEAIQIYELQSFRINKSVHSRAMHLHETPEQLKKLHQLWLTTNSSNVFVKEFDLCVSYYMYSHQYNSLHEYCQKIEGQLEKGTFNILRFDFAHLYHALTLSLLKAKSYEAALNYSKTGFKQISFSQRESLAFHEVYFICALREKRWEVAEKLHKKVLMKLTGWGRKEELLKWEVLNCYLLLYTDETGGRASRDFENLVKAAKLGADVAHLIRLHILKMIDLFKSDRINEFLGIYPEIDNLFRSYHTDDAVEADRLFRFGKFLFQLINYNFEPALVKRKTKYIRHSLEITYDPYSNTEVIPFNEVVDFILNLVKVTHEEIRFGKQ